MHPELFRLHAELEEKHWWFVARREIMRAVVHRVLPPRQDAIVVDVGCGTGANIASLAAEYRCVGVDTSSDAIALAKQHYPKVEFVLGEAPGILGDLAGRADLFLSMDVLEHIEDDHRAFSELFAAARPGAHFLVTVPADRALWSGHDVSFAHYRRYDPARLRRLWEGLPATLLFVSHFGARLYPLVRAVRTASRLRGKPFGKGSTDLALPPAPVNAALTRLFAAESSRLLSAMAGRARPYPFGSSLMAVVRREAGPVPARRKPAGIDSAFDAFAPH